MTAIRSVGPRATSSDTESSQSLRQISYFIAAFAILLALVILRIIVLRWRRQRLSDFFRMRNNSQYAYGSYPPHESNPGAMYHGLQLAAPPAAYRPDRRVRATDTDVHGRRLGPAGEESAGKDALPAYDNFDRPPKYVEAGWSHGGPLRPVGQSVVTPSPEGEQSGMVHPNIADRVPGENVGQTFYDTHAVTGVAHGTEVALPPPTHHHLSSS